MPRAASSFPPPCSSSAPGACGIAVATKTCVDQVHVYNLADDGHKASADVLTFLSSGNCSEQLVMNFLSCENCTAHLPLQSLFGLLRFTFVLEVNQVQSLQY
jgi:hypothetical protein